MAQIPSLTDDGYLMYAIVIAILFFAGMAGQIISFFILFKKDQRQREMTPYLVNVAIANSMLLCINFPIIFSSSLAHKWVLNQVGCTVLGFNAGTTGVVMIITLTFVTVNIYKQITRQNVNNRLNNALRQNYGWVKAIAGIWVYSVLTMMPALFGLGSMALEAEDTNCAPDWRSKVPRDVAYLVVLTIVAFVIPVTIAFVHLIKIYSFLAHNQRINQTLSAQQRQHYEQYKNRARLMGLAILAFFLVWLPYCVCSFITLFGQQDALTGTVSIVPGLVAKSSVVYNPILYTILNRRFRRSLLLLFPESLHRLSERSRVLPQDVDDEDNRSAPTASTPRTGYDRWLSTPDSSIPRSPLTGRTNNNPIAASLEPTPPMQSASAHSNVSYGYKPSIRSLLRPPF